MASISPEVPAPQAHTFLANGWTFSQRLSATTLPLVDRVSAARITVSWLGSTIPTIVVPVWRYWMEFELDFENVDSVRDSGRDSDVESESDLIIGTNG
mmetsp:Transcript_18373/g.25887  ORF Transcript_18373/g.25887 Transcript_18373/m.25887 type:complete len:98 (-) Transcript_18373:384-677(-)